MNVRWILGTLLFAGCCALVLDGCKDKGEPPDEPPVTVSRSSVIVVPGDFVNITVMGGRPPYYVSQQGEERVATGSFVDSTVSPATFVIRAPSSATINDNTTITVGDADEREGNGASQRTTHGPNSATVFVDIQAVGNVSYSDDIQPIWDSNCQNRGCHPGGGAPFSFDRFVSWSNIWFVGVTNMSCGAIYRVHAGNPDSSLIYTMVSGKTSCPRMPLSLDPSDTLSQFDQDKIRTWIAQGAENN
jgi:hypothetical protein